MSSTIRIANQYGLAGATRPCAELGHGHSWGFASAAVAPLSSSAAKDWTMKQATTKRPARRLERHLT
jgi:hypothetical protein